MARPALSGPGSERSWSIGCTLSGERGGDALGRAATPFFAALGDMQALVRNTVSDEGLNVSKIATAEKDVVTVRSQLVLWAEVNGEEDHGAKLLAALRIPEVSRLPLPILAELTVH